MPELTTFEIKPHGIAHLLSDRNWVVPRYQRAYKWEEKQINDLFNDVDNAIQEAQGEYFVGTVVAAKTSPDRPEIVDGQQRLATVTILIAAIRDYFVKDREDAQGAEIVENSYLFRRDLKTRDVRPRLQLSGSDHDFFLRKILAPPSDERDGVQPEKDSHRRIILAQELARKHILKIVERSRSPEDLLEQRLKYLSEQTRVILVEVPSYQNAFTIFETLNDRGITLAIADLLKNYLFHRAGDRIDEVQQRWIEMFTTIESAADEETVKDFIRHQWSSMHGLTRERQLYDAIKKQISTPKAAFEYVGQLNKDAVLYAALQNNSHEFWKGYGTATRHHVSRISDLGMERITPLLLAILAMFPKNEIAKSLRMIVCWGVRILVAGAVAGALEIRYSEIACAIRKGAIKTAAKLFQALKNEIPGDTEFANAFAIAKVPRAATARYYLQVLERQAEGKSEPEFVPNPDESEINLEHVLPQNPKKGTWAKFNDEMRAAYTNRIGNLALFKRSENRGFGNDEFADKQANLAASSYRLTNGIGKCTDWTPVEIEARQKRLAKLAVKAWPLR